VRFDGAEHWLHQADVPLLMEPPAPRGVRLLQPYDAWLQQRDRGTLLSDAKLRREIWRSSGNPGAVLANGELVASWRPRKRGKRLTVTITPFARLAASIRADIEREAATLAPFRDCTSVDVSFL
jgi:hypothetical protein